MIQGIVSTQNATTQSILTSAGNVLSANQARIAWMIQNLGTNPLFVLFGTGASTSNFTVVLKGATANDDGTGGTVAQEVGAVFNGIISVAGTSPRFTVLEQAP